MDANVSKQGSAKTETISLSWGSIARFFLIFAAIGLACGWYLLSPVFQGFLRPVALSDEEYHVSQLLIPLVLFIQYFLISLVPLTICAWIKKGFRNLKFYLHPSLNDGGVVSSVLLGLGAMVFAILFVWVLNGFALWAIAFGSALGLLYASIALIFILLFGIFPEFSNSSQNG